MFENTVNIRDMSPDELIDVEAGETIFYSIFFGLGYFAHAYENNWASMTNGMGTNMRR